MIFWSVGCKSDVQFGGINIAVMLPSQDANTLFGPWSGLWPRTSNAFSSKHFKDLEQSIH